MNTGLSIEPKMLEAAKKEAQRRHQSFSAYVCVLLEADLARAKVAAKSHTTIEDRVSDLERQVAERKAEYGK